jgi:hypothetical protein
MLRVKLSYNGESYKLVVRDKDTKNIFIKESSDINLLMPLYKSIKRNWFKRNKSIYIC